MDDVKGSLGWIGPWSVRPGLMECQGCILGQECLSHMGLRAYPYVSTRVLHFGLKLALLARSNCCFGLDLELGGF